MHKSRLKFLLPFIFLIFVWSCGGDSTTNPVQPTETPVPATRTSKPQPPAPLPTSTLISIPTATETEANTPETTSISDSWMKTYGANGDDTVENIILADDGGFYLVGSSNAQIDHNRPGDAYLMHTDKNGELLWEHAYEGYNSAQAIQQTKDDGLLISGVAFSTEGGNMDIFLTKLDQDGNEIWSKTYGGELDEFGAAWPMVEGGYILGGNIVDPEDVVVDNPGVAGYGGFRGRSNIYLSRLDTEGSELWSRTFGGDDNVMASSGIMATDSDFLILATIMHYPEYDDDITLLKVDQNGEQIWSHTWEEGNLVGHQIIPTSDGSYLIAGGYAPAGDLDSSSKDFLFIKVDQDGEEIWKSIFGDPQVFDYAFAVAETSDGGFIAVGDIVRDLFTWDADIILVKIDENGKLVWQQTIETNTHTMLRGVLEHPDGGYVITGSTYSRNNFDILLIKTDAEGKLDQ